VQLEWLTFISLYPNVDGLFVNRCARLCKRSRRFEYFIIVVAPNPVALFDSLKVNLIVAKF